MPPGAGLTASGNGYIEHRAGRDLEKSMNLDTPENL
jgi:hypothetical protein